MKKREFDKNHSSVIRVKYRYTKHENYEIYDVIGLNLNERLFQLKDDKTYHRNTWVRCESVIVFEIKTIIK